MATIDTVIYYNSHISIDYNTDTIFDKINKKIITIVANILKY
jgi:hypothetical protein